MSPVILSFMLNQTSQCITGTVQYSEVFWPLGYTYTFDSLGGYVIDSFQNSADINSVSINYAPVL